jgi:predicted nuclease of predicted toxin-antitoxin system
MMRFKVDENLPTEVAGLLSQQGHDAQTVHDEGIAGARDESLHAVCKRESRILVTLDIDFSDIRSYPPEQLPGTIVLRVGNQSKKHVLNVFGRILPLIEREPLARHLWIVEEGRVRIRGEEKDE